MIRAVLVVVFVLIATTASAQTARDYWVVGTSTGPDGRPIMVTLLDANLIATNGDFRRAWTETYYPRSRADGLERIASFIEIDCPERRIRTLQMAGHYRDGEIVTSPGLPNWTYISPRSGAEFEWRFVCSSGQDIEANIDAYRLGPVSPEAAVAVIFADR